MTPKVYIIAGPTGVGKTAVAIALARKLNTAIISADSRQCYKEMTIGTAKPAVEELQAVRHYFINEFPVTRELTAADYEILAITYLNELFTDHNTAVVCGGTGLYIKALCDGLDEMPEPKPDVVDEVEGQYELGGLQWLQQAVQAEDPEFYARTDINNPARLLRALSFKRSNGKSISQYQTSTKKQRDFEIIKIGLELPREVLYARINERVDKMMRDGLLAEAEQLFPYRNLKNLQTVGYVELFDFIEGKCTLRPATEKIKQHTRNYAKRQMTWFRKDTEITWLQADDKDVVEKIIEMGS